MVAWAPTLTSQLQSLHLTGRPLHAHDVSVKGLGKLTYNHRTVIISNSESSDFKVDALVVFFTSVIGMHFFHSTF